MTHLISLVALGFLGATSAYVLVLVVGFVRSTGRADSTAAAERRLIDAQVAEIMARAKLERELQELSWNGFRKFSIDRKEMEADGVCSFYLRPHDNKPLPPFQPGQFLTFQLPIPGQPKPVIRCYSLSDSPNPDYYRVTIKKVPPPRDKPDAPWGLSSSYFHEQLQQNDILDVKAPGGQFHIDLAKHTPVVLIGGGVGITPVLSMLNALIDLGAKREVWFFLGVPNGSQHAMKAHLEALDRDHENVHLNICYSDPAEGDVEGRDYHHKGHVSVALFKELLPSNNFDFYTCGPPPMMQAIEKDLREWGVPDKHIHYEAFGPATVKKRAEVQPEDKDAATSAEVKFARSGKTVAWSEADGSLLELAEAHGVTIDFGCRAGNCGTCKTAIQSGKVDYISEPGEPPEDGSCLACISVPAGALSLDA